MTETGTRRARVGTIAVDFKAAAEHCDHEPGWLYRLKRERLVAYVEVTPGRRGKCIILNSDLAKLCNPGQAYDGRDQLRDVFCERDWLRLTDVAFALSVSRDVVKRLVSSRSLASTQFAVGGRHQINRGDLVAFLRARRVGVRGER